jgi:hypothetical protein
MKESRKKEKPTAAGSGAWPGRAIDGRPKSLGRLDAFGHAVAVLVKRRLDRVP